MSSEFVVGIDDSHKSSSRILAPPGGKVSIDFTGTSAPNPTPTKKDKNVCQVQRNSSNVFESNDLGLQRKGNTESCQAMRQKSTVFAAPLEQQPKKSHPEKSSGNIIAVNDGGQEKLHTSVHVRAPPGGASSFSFG